MLEEIDEILNILKCCIIEIFECVVKMIQAILLMLACPFMLIYKLIIHIPLVDYWLGYFKLKQLNNKITLEQKERIKKLLSEGNAFSRVSKKNQKRLLSVLENLKTK